MEPMRSKLALPIFAEDIWLFLPGWFCLPHPIWAPGIRLDQKERREFYSKDLPKSHPSSCRLAQLCVAINIRPKTKEWHRTISQDWDSTPAFRSPSPLPNSEVSSPNIHCHLSCNDCGWVLPPLSQVEKKATFFNRILFYSLSANFCLRGWNIISIPNCLETRFASPSFLHSKNICCALTIRPIMRWMWKYGKA